MKAVASFDGMTWPLGGERNREIEWRLRNDPEAVSRADQLVAASTLAAYRQLVMLPAKQRAYIIRNLRAAPTVFGVKP